jgi:hypothetical protein
VFPQFSLGVKAEFRRLSKAKALIRTAQNAFNFGVHGRDAFEQLARVVDGCDCFEFTYDDLDEAVARFRELADENALASEPAPLAVSAAPAPTT